MAVAHKAQQGALYEKAGQFARDLEHGQAAAADELLAAWSTSYWQTRQEMDALWAKIAAAKAAGETPSPAWAYQQQRLKNVLNTAKVSMAQYAEYASGVTTQAQASAIQAGLKHAEALAKHTIAQDLPDLAGSFARVNPAVLEAGVGFLSNGTPLRDLLTNTLPAQTAEDLQATILKGLAIGWGQDRMLREMTHAYGLGHSRAVTILRTESLRSYRHASRSTYMANADVLEGWVWNAHLDARTCIACALMDGTVHPIDAALDGHPRCRCAMVPRTKSWEDLGRKGLADTRPPIRSGKAWLEAQPAHVQRAMMGPRKFDAWLDGTITLDDMVGRTYHPAWGTTRSERSLKAILEGRNENYMDVSTPVAAKPPPAPKPDLAAVHDLAEEHDLRFLQKWADNPEGTGPQGLANLHAAIAYKTNRLGRTGPTLPEPDPTKVQTMVTKMNAAVETKGYPSKGYSQVKAIYKAQANGTPGTQVGVVKSLTWEQKLTAQKALALHDEALPQLVRAHEKSKAIAAAWDEAKAMDIAITKAKAEAAEKAVQAKAAQAAQAAESNLDTLWANVGSGTSATPHEASWPGIIDGAHWLKEAMDKATPGSPDWKIAQAKYQAHLAKMDEYADARDIIKTTYKGKSFSHIDYPPNTATVLDDGWLSLTLKSAGDNPILLKVPPHQALKMLQEGKWVQVVTPDPAAVKNLLNAFTDLDGKMTAQGLQDLKHNLDSDPWMPAQTKADLEEAIAQAESVLEWAPEPEYVAKIVKQLDEGIQTPASLKAYAENAGTKPASKANVLEAVAQWEAQKVAKAAVPKAKPVIDPAKIKWEKVSDAQVAKLKAKVQSGALTVDDLYGSFQASKNAGPKANYAKAIMELEGHPTPTPSPAVVSAAKPATPQGDPWPSSPPWKPEDLTFTGKTLGTHGAQVWKAPDGARWLFKPPKDPKDGFLTTLDEAASRLQALAGNKAPDTYVVTLNGRRGSIQRMFDATDGFPGGFKPGTLSEGDLAMVQKEHVLDWLLANHDGHRDQFLRLPDGQLTAIDKGQAFRWFGQDRLDWDFHPNQHYGAPEPVYNALWRDFANGGKTEVDLAALKRGVAEVQAIGDDDLRRLLRPYAEQAAARNLLAKRQSFPGLKPSAALQNDVDAFLDAVVARKHALDKDFTDLYDRAAKARAKAIPGWKAKAAPAPTSKAGKWFGVDAPKPPKPPTEPTIAAGQVFDGWLEKVKTKYHDFSGKNLEDSHNWARVRRVIDDQDVNAVQELADRHYLDADLAQEARDLIVKAKAAKESLEADYKRAQVAHDAAMKLYRSDLQDWKDANGVADLVKGMDDDVLRHTTNTQGERWAQKHFDEKRYTAKQRQWLKSYTGSSYQTWNTHLRNTHGKPTQYGDAIKGIDNAMEAQPIPEDVILHRGTEYITLANGHGFGRDKDLTQIIGNVLVDHGYLSTSVGQNAAFSSMSIQLKIRAGAGTKGSYVQMFSRFGHERELILARGTNLYVHNAYKSGGHWIVECEVVENDFDASTVTPSPSVKKWTASSA